MISMFLQLWSGIAVAAIVYTGGIVSKRIAAKKGWRTPEGAPDEQRTWYDISLPLHPLGVAALLGILPWPTLDSIEALEGPLLQTFARMGWFTLWGAMCGQIYESVKNVIAGADDAILAKMGRMSSSDRPSDGGGEA